MTYLASMLLHGASTGEDSSQTTISISHAANVSYHDLRYTRVRLTKPCETGTLITSKASAPLLDKESGLGWRLVTRRGHAYGS